MSHRLDNTAVVVGTVTADDRTTPIPAMKVCALRFTRRAESKNLLQRMVEVAFLSIFKLCDGKSKRK
eukprot:gnl/Chilomastix_caulleri/6041.p1 GENE.gnl/Chilomastix_caulleri/6041~~gnl/Chilomastix_caulleri/6041.p1  ORF type:complete len:67 (+),score=5.75 gnl/Chilomastix_caulleri/6041:301-501(+)